MKKMVFLVLILVLLDQITKFYLESSVNYGAAFGILQGWKWLFIIAGFFVLGLLYYYTDKVKGYGTYGIILLFAGVIGNLIDRILYGYVRDFIDVISFPSFNLADAYNTMGMLILLVYFRGK